MDTAAGPAHRRHTGVTDLHLLATVQLVERDELYAAVEVPVFVEVHKKLQLQPGLHSAGKGKTRGIRPVLRSPEQRFGLRVDIGNSVL